MNLEKAWRPACRVHLSGQVTLEGPDGRVGPSGFPGRQGREVFAFLVLRRGAPVARSELAFALWGDRLPTAWDSALNALVSTVRSRLSKTGLDGAAALRSVDN